MMKRILFALIVFPLFFSACGGPESGKRVTIKVAYWGGPEEIKIINDTIRLWNKDHKNIRVELQHSRGGPDYISKILTQIAGDDAADIAFAEANVFVPMYEKNVFMDLTPLISQDRSFNVKEFFPDVVKRFTRKGKIYCIPRDTAPFACVFYNKKIFDESGVPYPADDWTFDDLVRIGQKLTKRDAQGRVTQYGFYSWCWMNFVYGFGGQIVDSVENPTRCLLDSPRALKGLEFYRDLCHKHGISPSPLAISAMQQGPAEMFMAGKLVMMSSGIWETPRFRSIKSFDWDVVMFPRGPVKRAFGSGGSGYCIIRTTKHPKEAWEVLKALAGDYGQEMLAKGGLAQPANMRIARGPNWAGSPEKPLNKKMLNKAVSYTIYEPFHPLWQEAQNKYLGEAFDMFFNNELSSEKFAKETVKKVNELMFGQ